MTQKDYVAIAKELANINSYIREGVYDGDTLKRVIGGLCVVFKRDNPNFDTDRFIKACSETL